MHRIWKLIIIALITTVLVQGIMLSKLRSKPVSVERSEVSPAEMREIKSQVQSVIEIQNKLARTQEALALNQRDMALNQNKLATTQLTLGQSQETLGRAVQSLASVVGGR